MQRLERNLSEVELRSLFEACSREAERLGGDERCAEYFYVRAQSSRVWLSRKGSVTVADMDIADWCAAIAWSAPGMGKPPQRASKATPKAVVAQNPEPASAYTSINRPDANTQERKQPRTGAKSRRATRPID